MKNQNFDYKQEYINIFKQENLNQYKELANFLSSIGTRVVFGTGDIAKWTYKSLKEVGINIDCFVTSDGYKDKDFFYGLPVFEISKLPYSKDECNIFVAISYNIGKKIKEDILKLEYKNVFIYDFIFDEENKIDTCWPLYNYLREIYLKTKFKQYNIDKNQDVLYFNNYKILNPFKIDKNYLNDFALESSDLFFPLFFKDIECVSQGSYENETIKLENCDIVLDCGANIGMFSVLAASKGCKVYAFEPIDETYEYLKLNAKLYEGQICCEKVALSNQNGTATFNINSAQSAGCTMSRECPHYETREIQTITIDEYVEKNKLDRVDFIKADIEGAERLMIEGAIKTIQRFSPKLAICTYHLPDDEEVIKELVLKINENYKILKSKEILLAYVPRHKKLD